ncbi:MAG: hypothetical protein LBT22_01890 [Peptococcaceae bacterium]|nr:hypothetical protein [Peptococcaceae bacterium]
MSLLISILLRYPEAGSVRYVPQSNAINFIFLFTNEEDIQESILEKLPLALDVYHRLEERKMRLCQVEIQREEGIGKLSITRDVESITQGEVGLIVEMVKGELGTNILCDEMELPEEEMVYQEEMIGHMLDTMRNVEIDKNVIALREEGKVLLFKV